MMSHLKFRANGYIGVIILFLLACLSTTNVVAHDKSDEAKIQRAIRAAPNNISDHATIRDVDADWTILREGSNGWTCFPGIPLIEGDKHPMCNDAVWMEWLTALWNGGFPSPPSTIGTSYMLRGDALVNNGNPFAEPGDPGIWVQEGPHIMMLFPTLGEIADLPRDPNAGGPYVMWDETPLVHVMFPMTDSARQW